MRRATRKQWGVLLTAAMAVQISGCGTIFYPERKGQSKGRIDPTVAILDGIGLLFFIIPGVIAFIIDFDNGTIYLPGTAGEDLVSSRGGDALPACPEAPGWRAVRVGSGRLDPTAVRAVVGRHTGQWLDLDDARLQVSKIPSQRVLPDDLAHGTR